ncbi:MAG: ATP-binding cassette domain-containing protein [Candidatus Izimaplasma sp.]|nr:ATP-binding cassette domain-containing protein [Candidatus Izimaplasma bacterium]
MSKTTEKPVLEVRNLKKYFDKSKGFFNREEKILTAVDDISFKIYKGETFGLVGESGCGKTTTGRTIIKLYEPTGGSILFDGVDLATIPEKDMLPYRKDMQMIFQDPYASLNGRMTVTDIVGEGIDTHGIFDDEDDPELARQEKIYEILESVGLKREHASRYPHEFSGGQRQRIGIARALAVDPKLIICDEPISALDVSIQAQVVNMLEDFQKDKGLTYLFIAHDLSMVKHISDRIGVMYVGKLMEVASSDDLYLKPLHPYTKALLSSIPVPDPDNKDTENRIVLEGDVTSPINPKPRCRFCTRCEYSKEVLEEESSSNFRDKIINRYSREIILHPETHELVVTDGQLITPALADKIINIGLNKITLGKEKCFNEVPKLKEVIPDHFVACHFTKKINKDLLK